MKKTDMQKRINATYYIGRMEAEIAVLREERGKALQRLGTEPGAEAAVSRAENLIAYWSRELTKMRERVS